MTIGLIVLGAYVFLATPFGLLAWALCRAAAKADRAMEREEDK